MLKINFYTRDNCQLCDEALDLLSLLKKEYPHEIVRKDITTNIDWLRAYRTDIPVLEIDDDLIKAKDITYENLEKFLQKHRN